MLSAAVAASGRLLSDMLSLSQMAGTLVTAALRAVQTLAVSKLAMPAASSLYLQITSTWHSS